MGAFLETTFTFLGRLMLAAIFLGSAAGKMAPESWERTQGYMKEVGRMDEIYPSAYTVPVLLGAAIAIEALGGFSIALGYKARIGAFALIVFLIPATLWFHAFWTYSDPEQFRMAMINFMKNLAIGGALLQIVARGPGSGSLDVRRKPV